MATTITGTTIDVGPNKLVADSAGNVGIGTASPLSKLDVSGGFVTVSKDANTAGRIGASEYITGSTANDLIVQATGSGVTKLYQSGVNSLNIDAAGIVTKPLQPAFSARAVSTGNLAVTTWHTLNCTEVFDNNADFDASTNKFTAPVTGRYQLNLTMRLDNLQTNADYFYVNIETSNRQHYTIMGTSGYSANVGYFGISSSVLTDMDAGDVAYVQYYLNSGNVASSINNETRFTGYLVC